MEQKQIIKTHRIGTVTFGVLLVLFGGLFLTHIFVPVLSYQLIFHLWPLIFVLLGIEVLIGNYKITKMENEQDGSIVSFIYDRAAIFLMICLVFFAMVMAAADYLMKYGSIT